MSDEASAHLLDEVRCYFPEWADRAAARTRLLEAEHNSYLAGGYAEEFGYHVQLGRPPLFTPLLQDPERSPQWRVQVDGLHPGYPECPRPADRSARDAEPLPAAHPGGAARHRTTVSKQVVASPAHSTTARLPIDHFVPVDRRGAAPHSGLLWPVAAFWNRLKIRMRDHRI